MLTVTISNSWPGVQSIASRPSTTPLSMQTAQHRAPVIVQRQDHRPLAIEKAAELDPVAVFVAELEIQRELGIEVLGDADFLQGLGHLIRQLGVHRSRS